MSEDDGRARVVFDCMIVLQGAARPSGPAAACLRLVEEGRVTLCLSPEIVTEFSDVLSRPELKRKFSSLTSEWVGQVLTALLEAAVLFEHVPAVVQHARDPKDEPYLNLAIAAAAEYLVTRDRDLLDLMDLSRPEGKEFRDRFPSLHILAPVAFLQRIT